VILEAAEKREKASDQYWVNAARENVCINLTRFFEEADKRFPEFKAKQLWMSVANLPSRTAQCVLSYVSTGLNNTFSNSVVGMAHRRKLVDFAQLGRKKTALFITTSPVNVTGDAVVNLMYGEEGATTIIDNCDTYVYMGGMDLKTCENVSRRVNRTLDSVLSMPLEQVIVFRRGNNPVMARRYQTLEDSVYKESIG
jgi:hypothetical protein